MGTVELRTVGTNGNFEAYVLPVSGYPIPDDEYIRIERYICSFCRAACQRWNLFSEVFFQLEQLDAEGCREAFSDNAREWLPQSGLGVWVDREPPQKWTKEETANIIPGDKLRPIMFQVFRVSTEQPVRDAARAMMLRFGSVMEILTPHADDYLAMSSPIFKEGIVDRSFTCFPYYAGLMEAKTIMNATPQQLDRWFEGIGVYVRQSFEDKGILLASGNSLRPVFESLHGTCLPDRWRFPV